MLVVGFGLVEAVVGFTTGSLALIGDAAHMLTDAAALGLAWGASRIAARPASARFSYGYERAETLAAFVNALALLALLAWLLFEAAVRLRNPRPIEAGVALVVAVLGLVLNLVLVAMLRQEQHHDTGAATGAGLPNGARVEADRAPGDASGTRSRRDVGTRAALLHVLSDLAASVAAIVAMTFAWAGGIVWMDAVMAAAVALLMLPPTVAILRMAVPVLMDAVPADVDFRAVGDALAELPGVHGVHDLHVWQMTADRVALSAHVGVESLDAWPAILDRARAMLRERFGIEHTTLQPEPARRADEA